MEETAGAKVSGQENTRLARGQRRMEQLKQRDVGGGEQRPGKWEGPNHAEPCGPELRPEDFVFRITEYSSARNGYDLICVLKVTLASVWRAEAGVGSSLRRLQQVQKSSDVNHVVS